MKVGIVYYSRAGTTKRTAEIFEEKLKEKKSEGFIMDIFSK
jgi:flavodoxin